MIKQIQYTYQGMNQDITKSKYPFKFYYEANNIRVSTIDSETSGSLVNEKGNSLVITLPEPFINTATNEILKLNGPDLKDAELLIAYKDEELNTQISEGLIQEQSNTQKIIGYSLTRNSIVLFTTDDNGFDCIWDIKELMEGKYKVDLLYVRYMNFSINNPIQALFNYENEKIQKVY